MALRQVVDLDDGDAGGVVYSADLRGVGAGGESDNEGGIAAVGRERERAEEYGNLI